MSRTRPDPEKLEERLFDPGWTPAAREIPALIARLATLEDDAARLAVRVLARSGAAAARPALDALSGAPPLGRERLLEVIGGVAAASPGDELVAALERALDDGAPRCARVAARALGKLGKARSEPALLAALAGAALPERRAIVEALGKLGGPRSLEAFDVLGTRGEDAELQRRVERARLLVARRAGRDEQGELVLDARLPAVVRVRLHCRRGLAGVLDDELVALGMRGDDATRGPEFVEIGHAGTLRELLRARTALDVALLIPLISRARAPLERIADALAAPATLAALAAWTRGAIRFRVAWSRGHGRAASWELARAVAERTSVLTNDPRAAGWELRADPAAERALELVPRLEPDPRFAYRRAVVPAASHPTLAAALSRLAGVRADDRVWDPFVGSALELVERARLGAYATLLGSDTDTRALQAAGTNLDAAGVRAELVAGDALELAPPGVTLILTNPPMGRRVARDGSIGGLLEDFVTHAARVLVPGGRMVWLSPLAGRTERAARSAGLRVEAGPEVDMGGFVARVQIFRR